MTTTPRINLKRMLQILASSGWAPDYQYQINRMLTLNKTDQTETLESYVRRIMENPDDWFAAFPPGLASETSFNKPKTGLFKLLKESPEVRADLGPQLCDDAVAAIDAAYKEHSPGIIQQRAMAKKNKKQSSEHASTAMDYERMDDERVSVDESTEIDDGLLEMPQENTPHQDNGHQVVKLKAQNAKLAERLAAVCDSAECLAAIAGDAIEAMDDATWHKKSLKRTLEFHMGVIAGSRRAFAS